MSRRHFQRSACRQLLVGIGHDEAAGIELPGGFADVAPVLRERAVTRDIHAPGVGLRFAVDHPFRQGLAHAAALTGESSHGATKSLYGVDPDGSELPRRSIVTEIDAVLRLSDV